MKDGNVGSSFYEIEVYDKNGELIDKKRGKGDSILRNLANLFKALRDGTPYSFTNTLGNSGQLTQIVLDSDNCSMLGSAGASDVGIVVGTGTTAVSIDDYNLESKIPHGTETGQLSYGECSAYDNVSGDQIDVGVQRSFDNNSGSDITINEIGLIAMMGDGNVNVFIMLMRDVISATTVPNGGRVTIKYWIRFNPA